MVRLLKLDTACHKGCFSTVPEHPVTEEEYRPGSVLAWTRDHWDWAARPCVYCRRPTNLRRGDGDPAHKVCAERHLLGLPVERRNP